MQVENPKCSLSSFLTIHKRTTQDSDSDFTLSDSEPSNLQELRLKSEQPVLPAQPVQALSRQTETLLLGSGSWSLGSIYTPAKLQDICATAGTSTSFCTSYPRIAGLHSMNKKGGNVLCAE